MRHLGSLSHNLRTAKAMRIDKEQPEKTEEERMEQIAIENHCPSEL